MVKKVPTRSGQKTLSTTEMKAVAKRYWEENGFDRDGDYSETSKSEIAAASVAISVRLPGRQLAILKEFARRRGVGYQTLMKDWLDERVRVERDALLKEKSSASSSEQSSSKAMSGTAIAEMLRLLTQSLVAIQAVAADAQRSQKDIAAPSKVGRRPTARRKTSAQGRKRAPRAQK